MGKLFSSLLIEEISHVAEKAKEVTRGLSIGPLIKMIRTQLGMSQKILSQRAGVPQSTISRVEKGQRDMTLSTLNKILRALSSDLVLIPMLQGTINEIRHKQARKKAENQMRYLIGTMSLEEQKPDNRFIEELLKEKEGELLRGSKSELWEE